MALPQTSYTLPVEGIGTFTFRRRTMRDEFAIQAEKARLTEGVPTPGELLGSFANMVSTLSVLAKEVPEGWDIMAMDPFDDDSYRKIGAVYRAMMEKEAFFRPGGGPARAGTGAANVAEPGLPVSRPLPAAAD